MPDKPTVHDLFKDDAPESAEMPLCPKCGGKSYDRKRARIGYDVLFIYCTGCKTAVGVVPAMGPQTMIEHLRREIKKT